MGPPINEEEAAALRLLAERHRLVVLIVPKNASDEFCARLTSWTSLMMDLKLIPPVPVLAQRQGDGLHCPFCAAPITAARPQDPEVHDKDCEWLLAMQRWAYTQVQIDDEVAKGEL